MTNNHKKQQMDLEIVSFKLSYVDNVSVEGEDNTNDCAALNLIYYNKSDEPVCATRYYAQYGFSAFGFIDCNQKTLKTALYSRTNNPKGSKGDKNNKGDHIAGANTTKGVSTHHCQIVYIQKTEKGMAKGSSHVDVLQGVKFAEMHTLPDKISRHSIDDIKLKSVSTIEENDEYTKPVLNEVLSEPDADELLFISIPKSPYIFREKGYLTTNRQDIHEKYNGTIATESLPVGLSGEVSIDPQEDTAQHALSLFLKNKRYDVEEALHLELHKKGEMSQAMKIFMLSQITSRKENVQRTMLSLIQTEALSKTYFRPTKSKPNTLELL